MLPTKPIPPTPVVPLQRRRLVVHGAVQGVGFRPFVYRLAKSLQLAGWVENTPQGVTIEVEGTIERLSEFRLRLNTEKPRLAIIQSCDSISLAPECASSFEIRHSRQSGLKNALVLPDIATCDDCLRDILDPLNRRYRYPFTNCTNCGPRFSIIQALPYDRANTSMKKFVMCDRCRREYDDPTDRRFHAQPNACPCCGPQLELWDESGRQLHAQDEALLAAARVVRRGQILALKGLGGFQLIVDARSPSAVAELRRRKARAEKPFAIMVLTVADAESLCMLGECEREQLASLQAPIVLLQRRENCDIHLADDVAPANPYFGVMLPYTPLHHLLMSELGFPVVATSGNLSDEPICTDEREAVTRLRGIADLFLVHNRPIVRPVDDSLVHVIGGREAILRRARGYAPLPIPCPNSKKPILAVGAHQKSTVALALSNGVFLSQHIGDLVTQEAVGAFDRAVKDIPQLYNAAPAVVACDLHPDYFSTRYAESIECSIERVQHHHAHVVSCMVENNLEEPVLGVSWDGTGFGPDGTIWGGEFLRSDLRSFDRVAHLRTFPLPGGESASREPRRSGLGALYTLLGDAVFDRRDLATIGAFHPAELKVLRRAMQQGVNCPFTSSMGRLFDAVASIAGIRQRVHDEGRAAMELEFAAMEHPDNGIYEFGVEQSQPGPFAYGEGAQGRPWIIDWRPMISAVIDELMHNVAAGVVARRFHNTLVAMILRIAQLSGESRIVLTGGCFQNRLLSELAISRLRHAGFEPYWHRLVPPNDGGISLGQAIVAQHRAKEIVPCV